MSTAILTATAIRWLGFLALAGVIGSLVIDLFVWPPGIAKEAAPRAWLRRWTLPCLLVLTITTAGELVIRTQTMVRSDFAAALWATPAVLRQTHFGTLWLARFLALTLSMALLAWASRPGRMIMLLLALAIALTTSLTGHAGDWGFSFTAGNDLVHVVASATWVGGLIYLAMVGRRIVVRDAASLSLVGGRFSRLAAGCLIAVLASGSYNAWVQVRSISALGTTRYGHVLLVKLLFVLGLVCFGAVNRYVMLPSLGSARGRGFWTRAFRLGRLMMFGPRRVPRLKAPSRFLAYVSCEAVLGTLIFGCTAVLVDSPPARHAAHAQHRAGEEHGSLRTTMAALHASGGVPTGWMFTPPPGDAAKGREIFIRLQCFACHTVGGEKFPPTAGPGPELTDVGEHHPAGYLLESILNPNAVIVDGPGYTGADGRSIMPDYRGRLSVSELIDLVAYLKSL
jgi:putative copper export protein/mono/diheme cytochrome c family protein